jgi:AAA family ATP:ADP antiporter
MLQRVLSPIVDVRKEETRTALLMFAYAFLAMTAYNIIQPLTRSKLISSLGAVNVPWVILGSGLVMGFIMVAYTRAVSALPRRWALPLALVAMASVMVGFWALFQTGASWIPVAFYVWGNLLGILLISQFWTLANGIYDPRQAKRLFGFIGGGVLIGGMTGAGLTALIVERVGANTLLLWSAFALLLGAVIVSLILGREQGAAPSAAVEEERGVSMGRALALLRGSRQIQLIATVIAFGALGAAIFDQQLNMATEIFKASGTGDSMGAFLAKVRFYVSAAGFVLQVWVTPRIHRYLGIGFALLMLPTNLAIMSCLIILNHLSAAMPAIASTTDRSVRYTVDKTSREVLFLPLPLELRQEVKPLVDVTVDRMSKGLASLLILVLIQPWGLRLAWYQLSVVGLGVAAVWYVMAFRAKREYLASFRRSLEARDMEAQQVRLNVADLSTIETLVQELAHPDPARVVYAIDILESLDKRNLVTPLLLYHQSAKVRRRALHALGAVRSDIARQWLPHIGRMVGDEDSGVRAAALGAIAQIGGDDAAMLARPLLNDPDPRIRATAAVALGGSAKPADVDAAEATLVELISDARDTARPARRDVARAIREIGNPRLHRLLIPLLYDSAPDVADQAMESVQSVGASDFVFVPTLVALLRHRQLKGRARAVLVSYGEPVVDALAHFMRDPDEDPWVRRHIPATLAQIPSQRSVDALIAALSERDGFLRYKAVAALDRLRRADQPLTFAREPVEALALKEARHYYGSLSLHYNVFATGRLAADSVLAQALTQKMQRTRHRIYRLLSLLYPWRDIAAAEWTLAHADPRSRASASEYLDNILTGQVRKDIMPILEDLPLEEKVRRGNVLLRTRRRDLEETLLHLINDDDQVVAASAIDMVRAQGIWALAEDIEHILAHRDPRDWYVFEAASWALAERRMAPERRRELWHEPLPAAELATRLRALPLFAAVSVDEIYRVAGTARQARHEAGTILMDEGAVPDAIHILIDGRVTATNRAGESRSFEAPAAPGFTEALEGLPMGQTFRTAERSVTLTMATEELRTLLADNTDLVRGLFATLAERVDVKGRSPVRSTGAAADLVQLAEGGLLPIEKVLAVQRVPVFSRIAADDLRHIAEITHRVDMTAGTTLFEASAPPALWLIMLGEVSLEDPAGGEPIAARAGDTIGSFSALSGQTIGRSASVIKEGLAMRIDREELFELLGEHPGLMRQLFAAIFRTVAEEHRMPA